MDAKSIKNSSLVKSRTKHIHDATQLKIIDFICDYSFEDTQEVYTNGAVLVPLYRVLDAIAQKGEPYQQEV